MKTLFLFILLFSFNAFAVVIWDNPPVQLPANVKEWLHLEVKVNPGATDQRTDKPIRLEHVEIPLELLGESKGLGLRADILSSLVVKRDGKSFVRWIFNPEDTMFKPQVLAELQRLTGTRPEIKSHFVGYLTASRSLVVQDSVTGAVFSLKASTNNTGGNWTDKKMTSVAAKISRAYNDFIVRNADQDNLKSFVALKEPLAYTFASLDQAFTIRDYPLFWNNKVRAIPFFAALHPVYGREFAERKGANPSEYWTKHLTEPWGRAMAEGLSHYGFYPNSAHSQDFLIEMTAEGHPTGRIYVRDIMDSDADRMILEARNAHELLDIYKGTQKIQAWSGKIYMKAIPFNGHGAPNWLDVTSFMKGFHQGFTTTYESITKVSNFTMPPSPSWYVLEKKVETDPNFVRWTQILKTNTRAGACGRVHLKAM